MDDWDQNAKINSVSFKKRNYFKCLFQRNTVLLKIIDHHKWPPEVMAVQHKCMGASASLK